MDEYFNMSSMKCNDSDVCTNSSNIAYADILVSGTVLAAVETVLEEWISLFVCLLGIVTNVLEIRVFVKQGFKDTVNISMTFIAFWDLIRVISGAGHRLSGPISIFSSAFAVTWQNVTTLNLTFLHNLSSNVSYILGAYVAVERCLCVSIPFKVKVILTTKLTVIVCTITSLVVFTSCIPIFLVFESKWIYSDQYKTSIVIYQESQFYKKHGITYQTANRTFGTLYPTLSLTILVFSTLVISFHLRKASISRHVLSGKKANQNKYQAMSAKEKQVVRMLLVIINIYIINLIPRVISYLTMLFVPDFYTLKLYNNIFWVIMYIVFFFDFLHSSLNLFVFYTMSSNFRKTFDHLFKIKSKTVVM